MLTHVQSSRLAKANSLRKKHVIRRIDR